MNILTRMAPGKLIWSGIGYAISLLITAVAVVTLWRLLRDVDIEKVVAALQATSRRTVLIAECSSRQVM